MPVLLKAEPNSVFSTVDVEALVNEVRERLCLKHRERMCSSSRRSAPYSLGHGCYHRLHKHPSPESSCHSNHRPHRPCQACSCHHKIPTILDSKHLEEDPHVLLEKLLSEQSLIQEAVRRLQTQTRESSSSSSSTSRKLFHFVDEDSCDQFSSQTPGFSESEDDCVSQNSIELWETHPQLLPWPDFPQQRNCDWWIPCCPVVFTRIWTFSACWLVVVTAGDINMAEFHEFECWILFILFQECLCHWVHTLSLQAETCDNGLLTTRSTQVWTSINILPCSSVCLKVSSLQDHFLWPWITSTAAPFFSEFCPRSQNFFLQKPILWTHVNTFLSQRNVKIATAKDLTS